MTSQAGSSKSKPRARSLDFACGAMGGTVLPGAASAEGLMFAGAATDNRQVTSGRLFFALKGERVDGFQFCADAVHAGAAAVVVENGRGVPAGCDAVPVIGVTDTRKALGDLARAVRLEFAGHVVGVTGSNGKTTTKELIAAVLSSQGSVLRTAGNLNTDVGLPLTILEATGKEWAWVLEMAMRARGEIAYLAEIARPHVGLVTNVAAAHLGRLGSLIEVARAKGEIFHNLAPGGIGILPCDDPLLEAEAQHLPENKKLRFGAVAAKSSPARPERAQVRILDFSPAGTSGSVIRFSVADEPLVVRLPLPGEHNARNAAAALAVALALRIPRAPAVAALGTVALPPHRSQLIAVAGRTIFDDCYNANPASMSAALGTLAASAGRSTRAFAVLGDMLELGPDSVALHEGLGREVASRGLSGLIAMGELGAKIAEGALGAGMAGSAVLATMDPDEAAQQIADWSAGGDWILIKASRGARLERVIDSLGHRLKVVPPVRTLAPTQVQTPVPARKKAPKKVAKKVVKKVVKKAAKKPAKPSKKKPAKKPARTPRKVPPGKKTRR